MKKIPKILSSLVEIGLITTIVGSGIYGLNNYNQYKTINEANPKIQRLVELHGEGTALEALVKYKTDSDFRSKYEPIVNEYIKLENDSQLIGAKDQTDSYERKFSFSFFLLFLSSFYYGTSRIINRKRSNDKK